MVRKQVSQIPPLASPDLAMYSHGKHNSTGVMCTRQNSKTRQLCTDLLQTIVAHTLNLFEIFPDLKSSHCTEVLQPISIVILYVKYHHRNRAVSYHLFVARSRNQILCLCLCTCTQSRKSKAGKPIVSQLLVAQQLYTQCCSFDVCCPSHFFSNSGNISDSQFSVYTNSILLFKPKLLEFQMRNDLLVTSLVKLQV